MIVVSDASPITALLAVGEVGLLARLFGEVIIPVEVHAELLQSHVDLPSFIRVVQVMDLPRAISFRAMVDAGEAEAIQIAKELEADRLLIDDAKGRKFAQREGIQIIGLLGVVLLAKANGLIPSASQLLHRLKDEAHVYLSDEIIAAALSAIGEDV